MIYIYGAAGSGKSKFAEDKILEIEKNLRNRKKDTDKDSLNKVYLATMKVYGDEGRLRVEKHRKERAGKGFITIEEYENIGNIDVDKSSLVLLECISNLVANNKFKDDGSGSIEENNIVLEKIWKDICLLDKRCLELVIVGNDIYNDNEDIKKNFSKETLDYIDLMYDLHRRICDRSSESSEIVFGIEIGKVR